MASGRSGATSRMTSTSLYFQINDDGTLTPKIFLQYLEHHLKLTKRRVNVKLCCFRRVESQGFVEAEVQFPSVNKAKKSRHVVSKVDQTVLVSLFGFKTSAIIAEIEKLCRTINNKQVLYLQHHKEKITAVHLKISNLQSKRVDISSFKMHLDEKDALTTHKQELERQRTEFVNCSVKLCGELEHLKESVFTSRKPVRKRLFAFQSQFARECVRFQKALPIYARRTDIIRCIKDSQVCVVIGETGSGKSTQLVQYLYDAGFAKDRIIACTQPRKVAAAFLAEHVSSEMCCTQGSLVSSKVSATKQVKENTKILYLTDHALLNECIQDRTFSKYSCLIIDEAHERSLHTDILLAFIKQCLPLRPDLKVIITSATIDPQLFVNYFGECPVLKVSGRTFPVDVIWCPLTKDEVRYPSCPYLEEAVDHAVKIHFEQPQGAILVFLTSVYEIELACSLTENIFHERGDIIVLPLHGRLQPDDQKKVFQMYENKRKIVFSTNVAETSITIPDVKYIIDSGYSKEMCFDARRNMNSLEVRRISKSSAEQRKGRAGRVSAGKCYRLFSEDVFETMPDRGLPEILRVHLTHAVLKLFEFGVTNVVDFDFVEMPDVASLRAAVNMLTFLGAIDHATGKLSEKGKNLALFPIDPQLGKILLDSIEENVILEAAIAVAVSSLGGNIFFRGQTDEMKAKSDRQKIKFVHPGGDQLTALNVFKEWVAVKKEHRNKWCVENCINAKSMRLVEETLKDLFHIIASNLGIRLPSTKSPNIELAEKKLLKVFFNSFLWNLGIYLGHEKAGYMTPQIAGEQLFIFPGSSLVQCNVVPKYLAYEKTLKTSNQYLLQVMTVEQAWVEEAVACGNISLHQLKKVEEYTVKEIVIPNVGSELMRCVVIRPKKQLIEDLKCISQNYPLALDCSFEKGTVSIFSSPLYELNLTKEVTQRLNINREKMKQETLETGTTKPEDDVKLVLGVGGCIQYVMMPLDFHTLIVKGPVQGNEYWIGTVKDLMQKSGKVDGCVTKKFSDEIRIYIKFSNPKEAYKALKSEKASIPESIHFQPQTIRGKGEDGVRLFRLQIDWTRRKRRDFCFVEFENRDDQLTALGNLCGSLVYVNGYWIRFKPAKESSANLYQLFIPKVSESITQRQLEDAIKNKLFHDNFKLKFGLEKPFPTTREKVDALHKQLHQVIGKYASEGQFRINVKHPENHHITFRSYVDFYDPDEGHTAMNGLEEDNIEGMPLTVKLLLSSLTRVSSSVYQTVETDLNEVKANLQGVMMKIIKHQINCTIELSSGDLNAFVAAKKDINAILRPCSIKCDSEFLQQFLQSHECRKELDLIQSTTGTLISQNFNTMSLNIYGKKTNIENARSVLTQRIKDLEASGLNVYEVELRSPRMPPGLMRHITKLFGVDLQDIFQIKGIRRAAINPRKHILSLFADENAFISVQEIIKQYGDSISAQETSPADERVTDLSECCVCYTEIEDVKDIYRLEYCGHTYHFDCIKMQLASHAISFPVECAADGCSHPFVWQDFENLCKKGKLSLYTLVESSLKAYLAANKDKARNCPTPDCRMVYAVSEVEGRRFICAECGTHVCTKCHVQYHDGLTCKMYHAGKHGEEEFQLWLKADPSKRKHCSSCRAPIEKVDGCNKVTCSQCHANLCWVCLEYFQTEDQCYKHLRESHGGFA